MEKIVWVSQDNHVCNVRLCAHHTSSFIFSVYLTYVTNSTVASRNCCFNCELSNAWQIFFLKTYLHQLVCDCADIDECVTKNGGCAAEATCSNTVGSYTCTCSTGYTGDGTTCAGKFAQTCRMFSEFCKNCHLLFLHIFYVNRYDLHKCPRKQR